MTIRTQVERVSKRYGRHVALSEVTIKVASGEILGLIGPNGAGKTTLLRLIAGLLKPDSGTIVDPAPDGQAIVRYFAGEHTLPPDVRTRRWLSLWSAPTAAEATTRTLGTLSRGTRQRVGLESALAEPESTLLLLDEPWEGLDPDASRWLSDELLKRRSAGAGVIVSSHRIHDLADVCDRCVFLVEGRMSPESLTAEDLTETGDRSALIFATFDRAKAGR